MYTTAEKLLQGCQREEKTIAALTLAHEMAGTGHSEEELLNELKARLEIMKASAEKGLQAPLYSLSGLTGGNAYLLEQYDAEKSFSGATALQAMAYAFSTSEVNAHMGQIVAAPTAGAAGILPAALMSAQKEHGASDDDLLQALLTAAAIGNIIATNATVSGAEGGCQVECGSAAAMAAAALTSLRSDDPEVILNAASFALINIMGLICDPVGGLVEFPCGLRNASGVVNAMLSADMALAGVACLVSFDETVAAMYQVGCALPMQLRETALGGIAIAPSAQRACHCLKQTQA